MTELQIPDTVPARPGEAAAESIDLRQRFSSATVDMQTGQVTVQTKGVQKANSADMGAGSPVFSRVQSRSGTIDDAGLDTIVSGPSIPGDGVRLRDALAAGFISKDEAGNYVAGPGTFGGDTSLAEPKPDEDEAKDDADKKDDADDTLEGLGDEVETTMNSLIADTNAEDQLAAVHQVAATGEVSDDLVQKVAQEMGVEPEALQGQLGGVIAAFEVQAREALTKAAGVDSQEVLEWVWEHRADALNKAGIEQATQRSTAGYVALANEFVLNLDTINPDRILGADFSDGLSAHRDTNGKVIITGPDGVGHPWQSAVRSGLIKIK